MRTGKKWTATLIILIVLNICPVFATPSGTSSPNNGNADLLEEIQWLQREAVVFTAAKQDQNIYQAPSVMTVYTAEDIKRQGLRSVQEIIERTVGFYDTRSNTNPLIGSRGITTGDNEHFLLLIDGHNMNSIVDLGPGSYHLYPLLSHVKRVEIVRGPGSTLWGSDAALGIIHIITKNGNDINGLQATIDSATEDRYRYANVLYGKAFGDDQDVMFSFTHAESDGYPENGFYPLDPNLNPFPDYAKKYGPMDKLNDSWELYGKMRMKEVTFTCRASDLMDIRLYHSNDADGNPDKVKYNRRKHFSFNMENLKKINEHSSLETKLFSDLIEKSQVTGNPNISPEITYVEESDASKETRLGFELTLRTHLFKDHDILSGIRFVQSEIDPISQKEIFPLEGSDTAPGYNLQVVPDEEDRTYAAYVEDTWHVIEKVDLIAGVRVDKNTLREDSTKILPRLSTIWSITDNWTAKYLYNTGYVRPPIAKSFLEQKPVITDYDWTTWELVDYVCIGADKAEEVHTHDVQFSFSAPNIQTSLTGYYVEVENSYNFFLDSKTIEDEYYLLYYINTNTIKSYGVELEVRNNITNTFEWYGNYSNVIKSEVDKFESSVMGIDYSISDHQIATDNKTLVGFPHSMWNIGFNLYFHQGPVADRYSLNLHLRGWADRWDMDQLNPGEYNKSGSQNFLDINLCFQGLIAKSLDLSFYAKNLLNGKALNVFGTTILGDNDSRNTLHFLGYYPDRERSIGIKASYTF